jgi:predicted SprT family Zn-dependent metalloprotease
MARAQVLLQENDDIQNNCNHSFEKVMRFDPTYTGQNGEMKVDQVVDHLHCTLCNMNKPFNGYPFVVCWVCAGKMIRDVEMDDDTDERPLYKCESCGHEYVAK